MNVSTLLRPARRVATAAAVGAIAVSGLLVGGATATAATPDGPAAQPAAAKPALSASGYETKVLAGINRVRHRHHLPSVTTAPCAVRVATRWSTHLAATDTFEHQSMQKLLKTCDARYVGEVLGRGSVSPNRLVRMWLDSPPHRHILLSRQPKRIGVGATLNGRGEWVVAGNFMTF